MNKSLKQEYEWINSELSKIIFNKNQFTSEIISNKVKLGGFLVICVSLFYKVLF